MKKLFLTCALLTSVSLVSFAQTKQVSASMSMDPGAPAAQANNKAAAKDPVVEQMAQRRAKTAQAQYGLTADQTKKVHDAEYEFARQENEVKKNGGQMGPGQAYQMQLARDYKMKSIMTPEQYAKYEAATPRPTNPGMGNQAAPAKK